MVARATEHKLARVCLSFLPSKPSVAYSLSGEALETLSPLVPNPTLTLFSINNLYLIICPPVVFCM